MLKNLTHFAQTPNSSGSAAAYYLVPIILILLVVCVAYLLPYIIVNWNLFTKAGKPGWAIFIPVYGVMVMSNIAKRAKWVGITAGILSVLTWIIGGSIVGIPIVVAWLGFSIYILISFIRQYDMRIGFWAVYIFVPWVTVFLVKNADYVGIAKVEVSQTKMDTVKEAPNEVPISAPQIVKETPIAPTNDSTLAPNVESAPALVWQEPIVFAPTVDKTTSEKPESKN